MVTPLDRMEKILGPHHSRSMIDHSKNEELMIVD